MLRPAAIWSRRRIVPAPPGAADPGVGPVGRFGPVTSPRAVALPNAGIEISGDFLARAYTSPITLGIVIGYVAGKRIGILAFSWLLPRPSGGRLSAPVGWAAIAGSGAIAGGGFHRFTVDRHPGLPRAGVGRRELGVLSAALCAAVASWARLPRNGAASTPQEARALLGTVEALVDLAVPVDSGAIIFPGPDTAPVTLVESGGFECPYCGQVEPVVRELLAGHGDVRYVWRHFPLPDGHPRAEVAAEAAEAAADRGAFREMHDPLLAHQEQLRPTDLPPRGSCVPFATGG